jgi:hypothetical protein
MTEYLQRPTFSSSIIQDTKTQQEARQIANDYFKFAETGYKYAAKGPEHAQEYLDKFYSGVKLDKDLSTKNHQVMIYKNNAIVNFTGTESAATALKTWEDAGSARQSQFLTRPILTALEGVYTKVKEGITTAAGEYGPLVDKAIKSGEDKFFEGSMTLEQRYEDAREVLREVSKKYPSKQKLLVAHSLGGLIAKKMATERNDNALVFNAAIGKNVVHEHNGKTIMEFRIDKEFVTGFGAGEEPQYKTFTFPEAKAEKPVTNLSDPDDIFFSRFYDKRLHPHFLENFAIDKEHYKRVLLGEIKLKQPVVEKPRPLLQSLARTPTIQKMVEIKRERIQNKKYFFPELDLYSDIQNFTKRRKLINFFE